MTDYNNLPSLADLVALEESGSDAPSSRCCNEPYLQELEEKGVHDTEFNSFICSKCGEHQTNKTVSFATRCKLEEEYGKEKAEQILKWVKKNADDNINQLT